MVPIQYRPTGRTSKQIADDIEAAIRAGALLPGEVLPSVRGLATDLEVAAGTVAAAYRLLRTRGFAEGRGRLGTAVRPRPALATRSADLVLAAGVVDLSTGQPDPALLPQLRAAPVHRAPAPAAAVVPELLELARERFTADRIPTSAMTVTSGGLDGVHRALLANLRPGDVVGVEDPGWPNVLDLVAALGLRTRPVTVDDEGPTPDSLRAALGAGIRAVIVTNRAQNPTGVYLTEPRAGLLRDVLAGYRQTVVVEDDHAAELAAVPLATLAGATESWALVRSASKPYGPDLRMGILAGDETTVARVEGRMQISSGWVSTLLQRQVVALWSSTDAAAVVADAATTYDTRRCQLIEALAERGVPAIGATGINVWVPVRDETAVVSQLLRRGWAVAPGARFRQQAPPGIRITVSALTSQTIPSLADDLATAIHTKRSTSAR